MVAKIIDGKLFAASLRQKLAVGVEKIKTENNITPGLAVILVGEDPASQVYVRAKGKQTAEVGMNSFEFKMDKNTSEEKLLTKIVELNNDPAVNGILVQLPLSEQINEAAVLSAIDPNTDVDGFHVITVGRLSTNTGDGLVPCTPLGCIMMLRDHFNDDLTGKKAIVVGRSNIVGKPMFNLLLKESCTVTIAHSRTVDLASEIGTADIVIAAVGRAEMIKGEWLKQGAVVIDVGINRIEKPEGGTRLVGDVDFNSAIKTAAAITPVPGGVGPMTIACLLLNTLTAACQQNNVTMPEL